MKYARKRLWMAIVLLASLSVAVVLVLQAFQSSLMFFYTPTDLAEQGMKQGSFRLGGIVKPQSVRRNNAITAFTVITDPSSADFIHVTYQGILPDLFREGQGIVAQGSLDSEGVFKATRVLAKHDEVYKPPL